MRATLLPARDERGHRSVPARVAKRIERVRSGLWWVPLCMGSFGAAAGFALPMLDRHLRWSSAVSAGAAESMVSGGAGALATILGVAFSLTVVTLQLAAVQFTSRILPHFMSDRLTRWTLGTYIGTITYLLLVLRVIDAGGPGERAFVPAMSVGLGLVSFIGCVMLLAVFIHHLARSIQADVLLAGVGKQTIALMHRLALDAEASQPTSLLPPQALPAQVLAKTPGYVQLLNDGELMAAAPTGATHLRVEVAAGQFVLPGMPLLSVWPAEVAGDGKLDRLRRAFTVGSDRMTNQDVLLGVRQLVDIALRALSPASNDMATALLVVNELAAVVHHMATSAYGSLPGPYRAAQENGVTLLMPRLELATLLVHAFDSLPRAAQKQPLVLARLLEVIGELMRMAPNDDTRQALHRSARRTIQFIRLGSFAPWERKLLRERVQSLRGTRRPADQPANPS